MRSDPSASSSAFLEQLEKIWDDGTYSDEFIDCLQLDLESLFEPIEREDNQDGS